MQMKNSDRYPAEIFWSDEDEGFIATAPDLPGCSAFGDTEAGALAELRHAIAAWKAAAVAAGNPVPEPSQPAAHEYSGKFVVRMPKSMHRQLAVAARREEVSLNQYVVNLLTTYGTVRDIHFAINSLANRAAEPVHTLYAVTNVITNTIVLGPGDALSVGPRARDIVTRSTPQILTAHLAHMGASHA